MSPSVHKKAASISGGARQRRGVTYSCVRLEFYPNYNRFYQISAEIGHTPLHTFNLHTSAMAGLLDIDGSWLELAVRDVYVSLFSAPSIWECVGRHFTVTLLTGLSSLESGEWRQWPMSQPTMGASIPWIFTTFLSLKRRRSIFLGLLCQNIKHKGHVIMLLSVCL